MPVKMTLSHQAANLAEYGAMFVCGSSLSSGIDTNWKVNEITSSKKSEVLIPIAHTIKK